MPRRTATPATPAPSAPLPPPPRDLSVLAQSDPQWADNLHILRRHWKWANFSQFFYTFAPLLNVPDVFLSDIEDDLARGTTLYLPRIMHRLLVTLTQDRKLTIDNWQTALRRQHLRRDPASNPIGPEPKLPSRDSSLSPSEDEEKDAMDAHSEAVVDESKQSQHNSQSQPDHNPDPDSTVELQQAESSSQTKLEPKEDGSVPPKTEDTPEPEEESKDWLDLPMLQKLDSLHLLTDWQFQNPHRVRQLMKDDDDAANWRIEPIGYDAKTNAYWLIGPDRLWIQRVPPKPPRSRNLKRKRPAATPKKAARPRTPETSSDEEEEEPVVSSKRTRRQSQSRSRAQPKAQANGRATRATRRNATQPASDTPSPGKSTRAAKVQANKKLDIQAKELAEFQRQTAALASAKSRSPRKSRGAPASPPKRALGTRISARLRQSNKNDDDDDDDEWQQVPDEWLQESATPSRRTRARTRSKGKARAETDDDEEPEDEAEVPEEDAVADEQNDDDENAEEQAEDAEPGEQKEEVAAEIDEDADADADAGANNDDLLQKAGLESGGVSDLTDLSEDEADGVEDEQPPAKRPRNRKGGRRKSVRVTRNARRSKASARQAVASSSKSKTKQEVLPEPEEDDQTMDEPPAPPVPDDFVEWEAVAVTLSEWEHVADPFEKATHYLEKALYKMLTKNIIPIVTEDLREAEKRRRMEEAIVHRKRSSRIAMKESEKEEARLAAKQKAEEDEKLGRARRQEARQRKEEAERAKREQARDQRRKERDEREARARAKAERAEREEAAASRSTATPSVNGTQQSTSLQPSRVVTPNGVRTPDWILDCEVCHKQGVNMDDGLAMVSCGLCNRWQHIRCHDLNDQRSGRPRRDWEKQQFYCTRCRSRSTNGNTYPAAAHPSARQQQYGWAQQSGQPIHLHKPGVDPYAHMSDMRYSHRSPVENGMSSYTQQQQYLPNNVGPASYSRSSYPNSGLSFNHYQPDQRGLSSRAIPTPQGSWSSSNGGYSATSDSLLSRVPSTQYASSYASSNGSGMYTNGRLPPLYPSHSSSSMAQFNPQHDSAVGMANSGWSSSTSNGYRSPSMQEAAQSLAFMHDSHHNRYNSGWPAASSSSSYNRHSSTPSQLHPSSYAHAPASTGVDPLTGQTLPRVEPHVVGHGLSPHTNGTTSFNFPS